MMRAAQAIAMASGREAGNLRKLIRPQQFFKAVEIGLSAFALTSAAAALGPLPQASLARAIGARPRNTPQEARQPFRAVPGYMRA
jgi:hypothetical protein